MNLQLKNKVALVTGSSAGIGLAIARELSKEGCRVILNGRDAKRLSEAQQSIHGSKSILADLTQDRECKVLANKAIEHFGKIDILVANVGSGKSVPPGKEDRREWDRLLSINLHSATQIVLAAYQHLVLTKGNILCISSICGHEALGCPIAYAGSKAALNSFVTNFARHSGKDGVRINSLLPGNILFPGSTWEKKMTENKSEVERMLLNDVPLQRLGTLEDVSKLAAFLVSPLASFITGSRIVVDGGQTRS